MNTRDQFGNYLLLKKLSEDALGETFRAGKLGKQGVERVILLRVFNGQGLDGEKLAQRIQSRAPLQQALKSPNLGLGLDLGQVRGVPYVAYDYISGKTLAQLLEQAAKKHSPIPLDHALLMTERIALGLAVAYETRIGDERVQHGFLTPHLVIVSNEGELRLLGFEASSGLREAANHPLIKQSAGRYLAPEVLAGAAPAKSDDVYSLGAILFELLTGRALPVSTAGGQAALVDQAVIAADGGNLHPELANLLKRSLVAREQRIGDAVTWHKTLAKMMFEGQYNPTTFNLAFFMHNLFREEIERETQELELEKTTALPVVAAPAPAPPRTQAPSFGQSGGAAARETVAREDTAVGRERQGMEAKPAKNNTMLIAAGRRGAHRPRGPRLHALRPRLLDTFHRHRRSAFGGTVRHRPRTGRPHAGGNPGADPEDRRRQDQELFGAVRRPVEDPAEAARRRQEGPGAARRRGGKSGPQAGDDSAGGTAPGAGDGRRAGACSCDAGGEHGGSCANRSGAQARAAGGNHGGGAGATGR